MPNAANRIFGSIDGNFDRSAGPVNTISENVYSRLAANMSILPMIRRALEPLLDHWAPRGAFDFDEFISWYPVAVMFVVVGAPAERIREIKADMDTLSLSASLKKEGIPELSNAITQMRSFVGEVISNRRENPPEQGQPDLLGTLIETSQRGELDEEQLVLDLIIFFNGGSETVTGMLSFVMRQLIDRPHIYSRCAEDLEYYRRVVEEGLRHTSTSTAVRLTTQYVHYRDVVIPKDTILFFPFSVSGRDPGSFPDGDTFDPDRPIDPKARHVAFGLGRHFCIGQFIARVELQEALNLIAQRLRDPNMACDISWRPFLDIWGMEGLTITFTPV